MRMKGGSYFLLFLVLLGLFGILQSAAFGYYQAMSLPLFMSGIIFVLSAIELGRELRRGKPALGESSEGRARVIDWRRFLITLGWVVGFTVGIYLFGFSIAIPIFVFAYLKWRGWRWYVALGYALVTLAVIYG
ncbi:MAG: tripartite tricarboxylate transporter TctB family protein, partial [Chloroflexota bacterium]